MLPQKYKKIELAAREGGKIINKYYGKNLPIHQKTNASDFYTRVDIEAEKKIIEILKKNFPDYNILSEESGYQDKKSDFTLIIDPLDGTSNFTSGMSYFSVAIGVRCKDEIIFSLVYNPVLDDLYYAVKGKGAYKNNKKIFAGQREKVKNSTIVYTTGYSNMYELRLQILKKLYEKKVKRVMDNWCPTLDYCLFASGYIDCIITNDDDLHESIIGKLLVRESGGIVVDFDGKGDVRDDARKFISVSNKKLLKEILPIT